MKDPRLAAQAAAAYLRATEAAQEKAVAEARQLRDNAVERMFTVRRPDGKPMYNAADVAETIGVTKVAVGKRWPRTEGRRTTPRTYRGNRY